MRKRTRVHAVTTEGSVFYDLFEAAEAERLSIQSGLALALEREIKARGWTQAEAAKRIGITQPRVNDLLRGRLARFSIDALVLYLARIGVSVRLTSATGRRRRAA
jgi:predicted XRE-type DNA-binding protein